MSDSSAAPTSSLWIHRPDIWSGAALGVALAGRSFRPSLMPRATAHQAIVAGASGAIGFGIGGGAYGAVARTGSAPLDLGLLALTGASGFSLSRFIPEPADDHETEDQWRPIARTAGSAVAAGSAAAALGVLVRSAPPSRRIYAGLALTALSAGMGARAIVSGIKAQRDAHSEYDPQPPKALPAVTQSLGIAAGLTTVVTAFRHSSGVVARTLEHRLGLPPTASRWMGRGVSVAAWGLAGKALADLFVDGLRTYDRVVDPGFDRAPSSWLKSGGPESAIPFARLGREGRRFVLNVPTRDEITEFMDAPALAEPIRVFSGYAGARSDDDRVALAVDELRRTGAFDRSLIVVGCAAGNGYVNTLALEVVDYLMLGDTAAVSVQYGRLPSFLTLRRVTRGARVQQRLLEAIRSELSSRAPDNRPTIVVYGESLGAWAGQDTFMHSGLEELDNLGVAKALWVGTPYYSAWHHEVIAKKLIPVPDGSVIEVDRPDPLLAMTPAQRSALRVVVLGHGNDPVRYICLSVLVRRPHWLGRDRDNRPWGVPPDMQFLPGITGIQVIVDAVNATRPVPGVFRATGHEYTADIPETVAAAYNLAKPDDDTWGRLVAHLEAVDAERASHRHLERRQSDDADTPDTGP